MSSMRILVTGANGFVGSACLREVRNRQCNALPLMVRGALRESPIDPLPGVEYAIVGNVEATTDWLSALRDVQAVIHTAGLAHRLNERVQDLDAYRQVNLAGTVRLATQAVEAGVRRFVFVSSVGVNGPTSAPGSAFSESDTPRPHNAYAVSKWEAEQELTRMAAATGLEVVIVRPPLVYGPRAPGNFGVLARVLHKGWPLPLGAIRNQRSFVGLDNLVDFLLTCVSDTRAANKTFMVSDGSDLSTTEFVRAMARAGELTLRLLPVPAWALYAAAGMVGRTGSVRSLCGDLKVSIDKARSVLGWAAPFTLDEGLRRAMLPM